MINTIFFNGIYAKINPICNDKQKCELPRSFIVKNIRGTFTDSNGILHYDSDANPCYSYLDSDGNREISLHDLPRKDGDRTIIRFDIFLFS
jgi:hypothetical protein